mmetsp:Transcript_13996/g.37581  ORF Transcript_13996/g.37581 Transcript_13996/m.37581 type:complete len:198 (-) Transcript_13996:956-1549(-)
MGFCPVPHAARDQAWLAIGAGLGFAVAYVMLKRRFSAESRSQSKQATSTTEGTVPMPGVLVGRRVAEEAGRVIEEFCGTATVESPVGSSSTALSLAHVTVSVASDTAKTIGTHVAEFDEYLYVLRGSVRLHCSATDAASGNVFEAKAGEALFLPAGHEYHLVNDDAPVEMLAICRPAFHPSLVKTKCANNGAGAKSV